MEKSRADERRSTRATVLLTATIECDGVHVPVRVANVSAHGALVLGREMPPQDAAVIFRCSGLEANGWMAWVHAPQGGINFDSPIEPQAILPKTRDSCNMIVKDIRELDFRRPGFRGNQMTEAERRIVEEWKREQFGS